MEARFYIDRQFGHPIHLLVEDGIFIGCTCEGKMEDAITKKYKGKTISEVKELYEKAFEGVYTCVHSTEYTGLLRTHDAHSSRIHFRNKKKQEFGVSKELMEGLTKANEEERKEQYQVELKLRDMYETLKNVHGFVFYEKKFDDLVGVAK